MSLQKIANVIPTAAVKQSAKVLGPLVVLSDNDYFRRPVAPPPSLQTQVSSNMGPLDDNLPFDALAVLAETVVNTVQQATLDPDRLELLEPIGRGQSSLVVTVTHVLRIGLILYQEKYRSISWWTAKECFCIYSYRELLKLVMWQYGLLYSNVYIFTN